MRNNREQATIALDLLVAGVVPFVEKQLLATYGDDWMSQTRASFRDDRGRNGETGQPIRWDAHSLLTVMWDQWNRAFRGVLGHSDRSLVSELREFRNQWAHQNEFDFDDVYRLLDSAERLLKSVGSPLSRKVLREKRELMRSRFILEAKQAYRKSQLKKRMWQDLVIYFICCAAIVTVIVQLLGFHAWTFAAFVVFVFSYLGWQRVQSDPPLMFGPHECGACRRIIYGTDCPYCERWNRHASLAAPFEGESPEDGVAPVTKPRSRKTRKHDAEQPTAPAGPPST
jgi:Swt1-like HEPN